MTRAQLAHFERRLREERERITDLLRAAEAENAAGSPSERAGDLTSLPFHPADVGTDTMQREVDAMLGATERATLAEIDAALDRLYRTPERFGTDERTGAPIPLARLELIPWARFGVGVSDGVPAR